MSTRLSIIKKSLLREEVMRMIVSRPWQTLIAAVMGWFLLMFLTLLIGLGSHLTDVSTWLKDKLGMYFYITQQGDQAAVQQKVLALTKELEQVSIKADYISADQAAAFLAKRLPTIIQKFQDYNINNPLPATLFVVVRRDADYQALQTIMPRYADIIDNAADVASTSSLKLQEQRVIRALDFAQFLQWASYALIVLFALLTIGVIIFVISLKLQQFHELLSLKKLLGATITQMTKPFIVFIGIIMAIAYWLSLLLTVIVGLVSMAMDNSLIYFSQLLGLDTQTGIWAILFGGYWVVLLIVLIVVAVVMVLSSLLVHLKIKRLA